MAASCDVVHFKRFDKDSGMAAAPVCWANGLLQNAKFRRNPKWKIYMNLFFLAHRIQYISMHFLIQRQFRKQPRGHQLVFICNIRVPVCRRVVYDICVLPIGSAVSFFMEIYSFWHIESSISQFNFSIQRAAIQKTASGPPASIYCNVPVPDASIREVYEICVLPIASAVVFMGIGSVWHIESSISQCIFLIQRAAIQKTAEGLQLVFILSCTRPCCMHKRRKLDMRVENCHRSFFGGRKFLFFLAHRI